MLMGEIHCPDCDTRDLKIHTVYTVQDGETRRLYYCADCPCYFSVTYGAKAS
jgi:protein-arginine kinase activator protein McsA